MMLNHKTVYKTPDPYYRMQKPKVYTWKCQLFGGGNDGLVLFVEKPPFIFWRWTQYLCFGNKWIKIEVEEIK